MTYEIWVIGYDKQTNITDYDCFIETFNDKQKAIEFAKNYNHYDHTDEIPDNVKYYEIIVETVVNGSNIDTVYFRTVERY